MAKLTPEQHAKLAHLLNQAADNLHMASQIVSRARFTERTLYVGGTLQEWLIDPLREDHGGYDSPYRSVGYGGEHRRKKPPSTSCVPK